MKILRFISLIWHIYLIYKVLTLLYLTHFYPLTHSLDTLTWWIYLLIFDVWLLNTKHLYNNENEN